MRKILYILCFLTTCNTIPTFAQIDTDRMMIIGRNALYFEDYVLAIQYFNQIIKAKPYLSEPYYYRAIGKYSLDDLKGAEQDITKALEINPYFVEGYNLRGVIRQKLGLTAEAEQDYNKGLEYNPENINLLVNKGIAQINGKRYEEAIQTYNEVIRLSPKLVSAYLNRGHAKLSMNDTIGGLDDFTLAIKANPLIPDGYASRAIVHYQMNNFDEALNDLSKAIELRPDDARFYMNRGVIRYQLDDLRGTVEDFDRVIELEPRNALAYSNRGILRAQIGDINRAIEDFTRVIALNRDDILSVYHRALLYIQIKEWGAALRDLNVVADHYPDFGPVYENRSYVKQMLGDNYGAELDYGTFVKLELQRRADSGKAEDALASSGNASNPGSTAQGGRTGRSDKSSDKDSDNKDQGKSAKRKATRNESDKDIRNYDKIAVLDDFGNEPDNTIATNPLRGRIQDRNIIIDMEPVFCISFYPGDILVHRLRYFNLSVDSINRHNPVDKTLKITNAELEVDRDRAAEVFAMINQINDKLATADDSEKALLYFIRGTLYNAVLNLSNAMDDYNRVLAIEPDNTLALFNRAYTRFRTVETIRSIEAESPAVPVIRTPGISQTTSPLSTAEERRILDYDLIEKDLERVLELDPKFSFAHYNLGMLRAIQKDYQGAIDHFTEAINANPDFAEAWYNRGLTNIYLENDSTGTLDLSKAGELGIFKAYNVIKRYGVSSEGEEEE